MTPSMTSAASSGSRRGLEPFVRAIGLDLGTKRIGVALSDSAGNVATPYGTVTRNRDRRGDHRRIAEIASEAEAVVIVVGVAYHLDGRLSPSARSALAEVDELRVTVGLPVETYDERLTTVTADRSLREMNIRGDARRRVIDQVAATVMLQAWLDHRASQPDHEAT